MSIRPIRVLVVDDSPLVRKMLVTALSGFKDIEVVGTAPDAYVAQHKILSLLPDVITLDIEMPRMDGLSFLRKLQKSHPMPVVVISATTQPACKQALEALSAGAVEVLLKPSSWSALSDWSAHLAQTLRAAASARMPRMGSGGPIIEEEKTAVTPEMSLRDTETAKHALIAIGASTGGPEALRLILPKLPANSPPILISQHIPAVFSTEFARNLNRICALEVKEAEDHDEIRPGRVLISPGGGHLVLRSAGGHLRAGILDLPPIDYHRPSINALFQSVAELAGPSVVAVLLTGMGVDGADGLLKIRRNGGHTIAQDEHSCVVFGMPKAAIERGAASQVASLHHMPSAIAVALRSACLARR